MFILIPPDMKLAPEGNFVEAKATSFAAMAGLRLFPTKDAKVAPGQPLAQQMSANVMRFVILANRCRDRDS
jgi:hypothetical protein